MKKHHKLAARIRVNAMIIPANQNSSSAENMDVTNQMYRKLINLKQDFYLPNGKTKQSNQLTASQPGNH